MFSVSNIIGHTAWLHHGKTHWATNMATEVFFSLTPHSFVPSVMSRFFHVTFFLWKIELFCKSSANYCNVVVIIPAAGINTDKKVDIDGEG